MRLFVIIQIHVDVYPPGVNSQNGMTVVVFPRFHTEKVQML